MTPKLILACTLIPVGLSSALARDDNPAKTPAKADENFARIQNILHKTLITSEGLSEQMPLSEALAALEKNLPKGEMVPLRLDGAAFGKDLPRIANAKVSLRPPFKSSLHGALRRVLGGVEVQLDYAIRPEGIVITYPRLAVNAMAYPVRDILASMPRLFPVVTKLGSLTYKDLKPPEDAYKDLKPTDGAALLIRLLANSVETEPWETVRLVNDSRLEVSASPARHDEIADLLAALRRLTDCAVVMNARLYEVDRAFYVKHIAPLFDDEDPPAIVRLDGPRFAYFKQQKVLLESDVVKIAPDQQAVFLSQLTAFRFSPVFRPGQLGPLPWNTGSTGVSFTVRPLISPNRRYLRLEISQEVSQLVRIDKTKKLDLATGKEVEIEVPAVRKTSRKGTVQIPDGDPILMPVDYRPTTKENEDKVWVLVARPFIWIEEEMRERLKEGGTITGQGLWDSDLVNDEDENPPPAKLLPYNEEVKEILQAIVTNVLTDPDLKHTRDFYGTAKDKTVALADTQEAGWPKEFRPDTHGYRLVEAVRADPFVDHRRVLGIYISKFDLKQKKAEQFDAPIRVLLTNAGGTANGGVIGGCNVYYVPKRVGTRWTVECVGTISE